MVVTVIVLVQVTAEAKVGFEPTNNGFAIRSLKPLGYFAKKEEALGLACTVCAGFLIDDLFTL